MKTNTKTRAVATSMTATRVALLEIAAAVENKAMERADAAVLHSLYGKAIGSAVAQSNYAQARKEKPRIPFMK